MAAAGPPWRGDLWGWHRLSDSWARRLVAAASVQRDDLVLDIGAGTGSITAALVEAGARVVAVELHAGRAAALRRRFAGDPVHVVEADARTVRLPQTPFRVVANPPFFLTSDLVRAITAPRTRLRSAHLVLQRTNARRWASGSGPRLAALRAYELDVPLLVPRSAFTPRPRVDAAVLALVRRESRGDNRPA